MSEARADQVSSFTIIKGALLEETYLAFQGWDLALSQRENLDRLRAENSIGATSGAWLRDVCKVLNRRFDTEGRDRVLVELVQARVERERWAPLVLWHMTRDEFLVRDFLSGWLYERYRDGVWRVHSEDLWPYLEALPDRDVGVEKRWSRSTVKRVAGALLKMAVDFGLMRGVQAREFVSYHLPQESFLYVLHALREQEPNGQRLVRSQDWRMWMMDHQDVERELFRLHQFRQVHYEVAGSLAQLELGHETARDFAEQELM